MTEGKKPHTHARTHTHTPERTHTCLHTCTPVQFLLYIHTKIKAVQSNDKPNHGRLLTSVHYVEDLLSRVLWLVLLSFLIPHVGGTTSTYQQDNNRHADATPLCRTLCLTQSFSPTLFATPNPFSRTFCHT